jgi:hypothetical protein
VSLPSSYSSAFASAVPGPVSVPAPASKEAEVLLAAADVLRGPGCEVEGLG